MELQVDLVGRARVEATFTGIARRAVRLEPAFRRAERVLEHGERAPFRGGRLEETGRLRASLTQANANDAIREAHGNTFLFGTSVPYARAAAHKAGEQVLILTPAESHEIAALTLEYVVTGE